MAFPTRGKAVFGIALVSVLALASFVVMAIEFRRDDVALVPVAAALIVMAVASIGMVTRCPRCRRSALWWVATKKDSGHFPLTVLHMTACPRCGHPSDP